MVRKNIFVRHYLFVHTFDEAEIEKEVQLLVDRVKGKDWGEIAPRLSRFFGWEYEDYNQGVGLPLPF